jgi:hypothetical protein
MASILQPRAIGPSLQSGYTDWMEAILAAIQPYDIHGTRYFRIAWAAKDAPDVVSEGRVAAEGIYKGAQPGDHVEIRLLLGVIDEVKKLQ